MYCIHNPDRIRITVYVCMCLFLDSFIIFITVAFKFCVNFASIKRKTHKNHIKYPHRITKKDIILSYDIASVNEITSCNNIDKPLVVYRFLGNVMTFIATLHTLLRLG